MKCCFRGRQEFYEVRNIELYRCQLFCYLSVENLEVADSASTLGCSWLPKADTGSRVGNSGNLFPDIYRICVISIVY